MLFELNSFDTFLLSIKCNFTMNGHSHGHQLGYGHGNSHGYRFQSSCTKLPGQLKIQFGAQFATFWRRTVGPRTIGSQGPTVRGPICHFFRADIWAPGPNCPGPNLPRTKNTKCQNIKRHIIIISTVRYSIPHPTQRFPIPSNSSIHPLIAPWCHIRL